MTTPPLQPSAPAQPRPLKGPVTVSVFGRTDVGRTREHNEDAFMVADLSTGNATLHPEVRTHTSGPRGSLFMVADGMGGAAAGEIASAMAVETVLTEVDRRWVSSDRTDPETFAGALKAATDAANRRIHAYAIEHPENRGMGTTATIAGLLGDTVYVSQVGDSRAYIVRGDTIRQITKDQSLMQRLIEANELTEEEAEQSERRNIILQALGPEPRIKIDLTHQQIRRGDMLLLCSDGLSGQVRKEEMAKIVAEEQDLVAVCRRLIDRANENGGPDNITVVAVRFDGPGLEAPAESDVVGHAAFRLGTDETPTTPVPVYVKRHSGTPPSGVPTFEPQRPTREIPPEAPPAASAAPRTNRGVIALIALLIAVAVLAWAFGSFAGAVRDRETAPDSGPAPENVTPDTARPAAP